MPKTLRRRQSVTLIPKTRWAAYATAGAATAVAGINSAEADIHYSGPLNVSLNATPGAAVYKTYGLDNFATIAFLHYRATGGRGFAGFYIGGAVLSNQFRGFSASGYRYPSKLGAGVNVSLGNFIANGGGRNFATLAAGIGFGNSQWLSPGTGFIGFKFNGGAGTEYGWARLTMDGSPGNSFTLVDFAWADSGTPIFTGETTTAVPEPGTLGLLAAGAAGLLLWRRQRANASS